MIVLELKCPQLSKPEATPARNENSIGDRTEEKPWEKPGSVGGGGSSPPARRTSSLFQLQQSQMSDPTFFYDGQEFRRQCGNVIDSKNAKISDENIGLCAKTLLFKLNVTVRCLWYEEEDHFLFREHLIGRNTCEF